MTIEKLLVVMVFMMVFSMSNSFLGMTKTPGIPTPTQYDLVQQAQVQPSQAHWESDWTGANWAGYEAKLPSGATAFTDAFGTFNVPNVNQVNQPAKFWFSIWVGIGGNADGKHLWQAGVAIMRENGGAVSYHAFYEDFPNGRTDVGNVAPGDTIDVGVWHYTTDANNVWWAKIVDVTTSVNIIAPTSFLSPNLPPAQDSAEWVVESHFDLDPSKNYDLPNFGSTKATGVTFTNARASTDHGSSQPGADFIVDPFTDPHPIDWIVNNAGVRVTHVGFWDTATQFSVWYWPPAGPSVGGEFVPVDKLVLLAPYIGLASTILVGTVASAVYVERVKRRKEKQ